MCRSSSELAYLKEQACRSGVSRLVHSLCLAYRFVLSQFECDLVLRLDQDALIIGPAVMSDAVSYMRRNPSVGLFGVYERDYNRPRSFEMHERQMRRVLAWPKRLLGQMPAWAKLLPMAEKHGYHVGENVFGGAYFVTTECLEAMDKIGALDVKYNWNSRLMEDVYFSMATVAAGFKLGHFAAPDGPLCLEWRGLPHPANELVRSGYKIVHSVTKANRSGRERRQDCTRSVSETSGWSKSTSGSNLALCHDQRCMRNDEDKYHF